MSVVDLSWNRSTLLEAPPPGGRQITAALVPFFTISAS